MHGSHRRRAASPSGGGLKDETIQYLMERAKGGFGLIFTGALAADCTVDPYTGIGPAILQNPDAFKMTATELNERANAYGTKIFAQITMGLGRNYPNLPAPSSIHVFRHPGEVSPAWKSIPFTGDICWINLLFL